MDSRWPSVGGVRLIDLGAALAGLLPGLDALLGRGTAVQESMALVTRLHDVAVVREPVQQGGSHLRVAEHCRPFGEVQVGGDHHAGVLVELAQQMEQQRASGLTERQVAQLVQDHQVHAQQAIGDAPSLALGLLLLQRVDQIDRRVEPHALALARDARHTQGRRQMRLARSRSADQYRVVLGLGELQRCELLDRSRGRTGSARTSPRIVR